MLCTTGLLNCTAQSEAVLRWSCPACCISFSAMDCPRATIIGRIGCQPPPASGHQDTGLGQTGSPQLDRPTSRRVPTDSVPRASGGSLPADGRESLAKELETRAKQVRSDRWVAGNQLWIDHLQRTSIQADDARKRLPSMWPAQASQSGAIG